jgi:hypothetical protein
MGKLVTVQKTITTEAVQINTPEEDAYVRAWLADMFRLSLDAITEEEAVELAQAQDLTPIVEAHGWFAKDKDSHLVYVIAPENFIDDFEEVDEIDIVGETDTFTFEEN